MDVREKINELNNEKSHKPTTIETADITGWYDNVDHYDAVRILKSIIFEVYGTIRRRIYLIVKGKNATWSNAHTETTHYTKAVKTNCMETPQPIRKNWK